MPMNPVIIGRTYPPSRPYEVGREKIAEFAAAIGDAHPAYTDPEAAAALGHPDVIAPPTFPIVLTHQASRVVIQDPEAGIDYSRLVHGEQRFTYTRPVRAGDRLVSTVTVDNVRQAAGNDMLTVRVDIATEAGEPVVTEHKILVIRGEG